LQDIDTFMGYSISLKEGGGIPLGELLTYEEVETVSNIKHQNFRRSVTVEADLDFSVIDTLTANRLIVDYWNKVSDQYPNVDLDYSGELDDVRESLGSLLKLAIFGVGLVYLILGTQFNSYLQPLLVLMSVPLAFVGVVFGLFFSANPMSLFTMYGAVALAGIAANDAIVLISTANKNIDRAVGDVAAITYAARRRVIPILITSITTIAGLFSLAVGLGGKSLIWGPVATTIVWGLGFSTALTLFLIPLGYLFLSKLPARQYVSLVHEEVSGGLSRRFFLGLWFRLGISTRSVDHNMIEDLQDPGSKSLFEEGVISLRNNNAYEAIICFEKLVENKPTIKTYNALAAQALIKYMEKNGWDVGYMPRARRYLGRARSLGFDEGRLLRLEKDCDLLDAKMKSDL